MRLIDVDTLKEKEQYIPCGSGLLFHGVTAATIDAMPVVDAWPVVHAYWKTREIGYGHKVATCSSCGMNSSENVQTFHEQGADFTAHDPILTKFCPNCGAQMDGGTENG